LVAAIVIGVILLIVFIYFIVIWVMRTYKNRVSAGREDLIGQTALVETALNPRGTVLVEGELWTAVMENGSAEPEEEVVISKVEGLKLYVTRK
jgi:membrane protein implicated in regulation of membrane protease activity